MTSPVIQKINTFDPTQIKKIYLTWDGNQVLEKRLVVTNSTTNVVVYDGIQSGYKLEYDLPANAITSDKNYYAQAYIKDSNNVWSSISSKAYFYAVNTPTFDFSNITENQIIKNSTFDANLIYSSQSGELLKEFNFYIYNSSMVLLYNSNMLYSTSNLTYKYTSLEDNKSYYLLAKGTTVNGLELQSSLKHIFVEYLQPSTYTTLYLENVDGHVKFETNLIIIKYNGTETFVYDGDFIDLSGKSIFYDTGFLLASDLNMEFVIKKMKTGSLLELNNGIYKIVLSIELHCDGNNYYVATLRVENGLDGYMIHSSKFQRTSDTNVFKIKLTKENDLYDLSVGRI